MEFNRMKNATLLFLIKKSGGRITDICLAMKKRGFGMGRWNGVGGKLNEGETIEDAAIRETKEEIGVDAKALSKVAELSFSFSHNPLWDQLVHVYFCEKWDGEVSESEEMRPKWFAVGDLPFNEMWPDDPFWLPKVISGKLVKGEFVFRKDDIIQSQKVETPNSLE